MSTINNNNHLNRPLNSGIKPNLGQPNVGVKPEPAQTPADQVSLGETRAVNQSPGNSGTRIPLHINLRIPFSMVGQLAESVVALVPESEVSEGSWAPKDNATPTLLPVLNATLHPGVGKDQSVVLQEDRIPRDSLSPDLADSELIVFKDGNPKPQGQTLSKAASELPKFWYQERDPEFAHLTLSVGLSPEQIDNIAGKRLALVQESGKKPSGFAPEYYSPTAAFDLEESQLQDAPVLRQYIVDDALMAIDPDKAIAESKASQIAFSSMAETRPDGHPRQLEVNMTQRAVDAFKSQNLKINAETGVVYQKTDQGDQPVSSVNQSAIYQQAAGELPSHWLYLNEKTGLFSVPKNRVVIDVNDDGEVKSSFPEGKLPLGRMVDKAGEHIVGESTGRPVPIEVDQSAIDFLKKNDYFLDLENARLFQGEGKVLSLDERVINQNDMESFVAISSGFKLPPSAEPWLRAIPGTNPPVFGKPHQMRVAFEDGGFAISIADEAGKNPFAEGIPADDFMGLRADVNVFRRNRRSIVSELLTNDATSPEELNTEKPEMPFVDKSLPNVTFRAPNSQGLAKVKDRFSQLFGERAINQDTESRRELVEEVRQGLANAISGDAANIDSGSDIMQIINDPRVGKVLRDTVGKKTQSDDLPTLLKAYRRESDRLKPLEIIVVPEDTHFSAFVSPEHLPNQDLNEIGRAAVIMSLATGGDDDSGAHRLLIGEEYLDGGPREKLTLDHEYIHIFESHFATDEELDAIDKSFEESTEFQSLYGSNRLEFLTTISEEFMGAHGADGPEWVKKNHKSVYDILSNLTGESKGSLSS